jgi:hypothetical protein
MPKSTAKYKSYKYTKGHETYKVAVFRMVSGLFVFHKTANTLLETFKDAHLLLPVYMSCEKMKKSHQGIKHYTPFI